MTDPELGIYTTANGAIGILAERLVEANVRGKQIKVGNRTHTKELFFQVTHPANGSDDFWFAALVPMSGKGVMWTLDGHPKGGLFLLDGDTLKECDYMKKTRETWSFKQSFTSGRVFAEPVPHPASKYPTQNFRQAVIRKDLSQNDDTSPDTDSIVSQYAYYNQALPSDPISRQKELIKIYTKESPLYHQMNQALREDDFAKMKLFASYIKELRDVFLTDHTAQIIEPYKGTVWRGITVPDLQKALQEYQLNKTFVWGAFTSTSTNKEVSMGFGNIVFEIRCNPPEGLYDDDAAEYAPANIQPFSVFPGEAEILFPPNTEFKIVEVRMPGVSPNIDKPLIICDTMAFDSTDGLHEFVWDATSNCEKAKLGIYSTDGNALAALSIQFGKKGIVATTPAPKRKPGKNRTLKNRGATAGKQKPVTALGTKVAVMSIIHTGTSVSVSWSSNLKPLGSDDKGRKMWALSGHPHGGTLIHNGIELLEFDDSNLDKPRHVWKFRPDLEGPMYSVVCKEPVSHDNYPTRNFTACVMKKDPSVDDDDSPDTQTIVEDYGDYEEDLPKDPKERQKALIRLYTDETPLYHEMNSALRDDDFTRMKIFGAYIKELQEVFLTDQIDQILTPFRGTVWRGITVPNLDKALQDYQPNKDFVWSAFTSTTTDKEVALGFGNIVFEIRCDPPEGFYKDNFFEYAPANIQAFSVFPDEEEILFPPNVKFRVQTVQMPSAQNGLSSPLVICDCTAFDGVDGKLHEYKPKTTAKDTQKPRKKDKPSVEASPGNGNPQARGIGLKSLTNSKSAPDLQANGKSVTSPKAGDFLARYEKMKTGGFIARYQDDLLLRRQRKHYENAHKKQPFTTQVGRDKSFKQGWGTFRFEPQDRPGLTMLYNCIPANPQARQRSAPSVDKGVTADL